jgi:uncharacterized protein YecE (DUF72 family)
MHPVRVATCGGTYQDWPGVFYPKRLPAGEYLSYVAESYPVAEVDSTFYRSTSVRNGLELQPEGSADHHA